MTSSQLKCKHCDTIYNGKMKKEYLVWLKSFKCTNCNKINSLILSRFSKYINIILLAISLYMVHNLILELINFNFHKNSLGTLVWILFIDIYTLLFFLLIVTTFFKHREIETENSNNLDNKKIETELIQKARTWHKSAKSIRPLIVIGWGTIIFIIIYFLFFI